MSELRSELRQRTLKGGIIAFNELRSTIDCTVRNLSRRGASLRVTTTVGIPDTFELRINGEDGRHSCSVIWRRASEIGVKFV